MEKHQDTIIPVFLIDLTQGAFDLAQFTEIKNMFRNTHGLKVPFVFSKFNNLLNDIMANMENEGNSLAELPFEEQIPRLI